MPQVYTKLLQSMDRGAHCTISMEIGIILPFWDYSNIVKDKVYEFMVQIVSFFV